MLPSKYISVQSLYSPNNVCFDTGVTASSSVDVKAVFRLNDYMQNYAFGARNTSSTSSVGQFNLYLGAWSAADGTGPTYLGYGSSRTSIGDSGNYSSALSGNIYFEKRGSDFYFNSKNVYFKEMSNTASFTGNKTLYIGALNNAGSPSYGSGAGRVGIDVVQFLSSGTVTHNYCPAYDTDTSKFGLYDTETDTFLTNIDSGTFPQYYLLEVQSSEGGTAYAASKSIGKTAKQYICSLDARNYFGLIKAIPSKGYAFKNWTINDVEYSTDEETKIALSADTVVKANFVKIVEDNFKGYILQGIKYGSKDYPTSAAEPLGRDRDIYTTIRSFEVAEDGLSKSVSKIVCDSVPDTFHTNVCVFILNPRGKLVYSGVIQSVDGNTITCREALGIFDVDFAFKAKTYANECAMDSVQSIISKSRLGISDVAGESSWYLYRLWACTTYSMDYEIYLENPCLFKLPAIDQGIKNVEDYLFEAFDDFGIYIKARRVDGNSTFPALGIYYDMQFYITNQAGLGLLKMSDDTECISNLNVMTEDVETTVLQIVSSDMSTSRGWYIVDYDGNITVSIPNVTQYDPQYIAYENCKPKVVVSDDSISTLVKQNLSSSLYNHKITFDVDLTSGFYRLDDFEIGRKVDFYYKGRKYSSMITARKFSVSEDQGEIQTVSVTLGKVRTKLTTKLNLGKVKK